MTTYRSRSVGIDPGKNGAVVVLTERGQILTAWEMPMIGAKGKKREYNLPAIAEIGMAFKQLAPIAIAIEKQQPLPPSMGGGVANFQRGYGIGIWEGVLCSLGLPYQVVPPKRWQQQMLDGVQGSDTKARAEVQFTRMFEAGWAWPGKRTKRAHDGIIDAALIAAFAWRQM